MMTKSERVSYEIALTNTVQGYVGFGLTRGDVDRLVALARVSGTLSLMAEVLEPGWGEAPNVGTLEQAQVIRAAVQRFDRFHPAEWPDLEARVEAAQIALSDLQPERL